MTRSEYNFEAFTSIKTEAESILYAMKIDKFFIDKVVSNTGSNLTRFITDEDIRIMHTFNVAMLGSNTGVMLGKPEMSFGFSDKMNFSISYRNYSLCDYLALIRFKEVELGDIMNKELIISQFKAILDGVTQPYTPADLIEWIFKDLAFVAILYAEDETFLYKKVYCPEFSKVVSRKDAMIVTMSNSYAEQYIGMRNERKSLFVTNYKKSIRMCKKSAISGFESRPFNYEHEYVERANCKKWENTIIDVNFSENPFFAAVEQKSMISRPNLTLVEV